MIQIKKKSKCPYLQIRFYTRNHRDCFMKLSEHINIFSKARAYKIIIRKSVAFLLTNINAEKEVIKSNSITIASNKKY